MRSPVGYYGFTTPYVVGPTAIPSGNMTSFGGIAIAGVDSHMYALESHLNDGFHTNTAGPEQLHYMAVQPVALPHPVTAPLLQFATFDALFVTAGAVSAGIAIHRLLQ